MTMAKPSGAPGANASNVHTAIVLACLMAAAAVATGVARSSASGRTQAQAQRFSLDTTMPRQFAGWRELTNVSTQVVNPETKQLLDKIYSQVLTRTYVNAAGYQVMVSIAYGDDQRGGLQVHKPEVCYPAQGFAVSTNEPRELPTPFGVIPVRRLNTSLGSRKEPVTYWFTMSDTAVGGTFQARLIELRSALGGQIPDGLLFRISSVDGDPVRAFGMHDTFVQDLLRSVQSQERMHLSGLGPAT
jgi:EpsI family protein